MRPTIFIVSILVTLLGWNEAKINPRLNFFDIDLLQHAAADKKGNVMVSPASIKSTLAMLLEGARGTTAKEIKSALRVSPQQDDFREELMVYLKALEMSTSKVTLHSANALFISDKLKLNQDFEMVSQTMYESVIGKLDFNNSKVAADTINKWVSEKTRGLISDVVDAAQIPASTEMMLANAMYFKSSWKNAFDVNATHSDCFYVDNICKNVAMMDLQTSLNYAYVEQLRAHAFELPYQDGRYSMIVLMPLDRDGVDGLIRDLPYYSLPQVYELMYATDLVLTMPKFSVDYNENMVEALQKMHINALFSKSANLTGIFVSGESPYLNSMYHSVHMKVDEVGTVAAATTVSFVVPLINNKVQLRVDRPFLFFIRDKTLGIVLFEGKIEEPTPFVELPKSHKVQPQVPVKAEAIPTPSANTNRPITNQFDSPYKPNFEQGFLYNANTGKASNHSTSKPRQGQPIHFPMVYPDDINFNTGSSYQPSYKQVPHRSTPYQPGQHQVNANTQNHAFPPSSNQKSPYVPSEVPNKHFSTTKRPAHQPYEPSHFYSQFDFDPEDPYKGNEKAPSHTTPNRPHKNKSTENEHLYFSQSSSVVNHSPSSQGTTKKPNQDPFIQSGQGQDYHPYFSSNVPVLSNPSQSSTYQSTQERYPTDSALKEPAQDSKKGGILKRLVGFFVSYD